jgi:hypothetical protein
LADQTIKSCAERQRFGASGFELIFDTQQLQLGALHLHRRHITQLRATRSGIAEQARDFNSGLSQQFGFLSREQIAGGVLHAHNQSAFG